MKKYDLAVIIGRFQPIHKGHLPAFEKANEVANKTICVIGSANKPPTSKNPFSVDERIAMIDAALYEINPNRLNTVKYVAVEDTWYLEHEWFRRVKREVGEFKDEVIRDKEDKLKPVIDGLATEITEALGEFSDQAMDTHLHLHGELTHVANKIKNYRDLVSEANTCRVAVMGHEKDESSYYLKNFSSWDLVDIGAWVGDSSNDLPISATDVRDLWFSGKLSFTRSNLRESTYTTLLEWDQDNYLDLKEEWEFLKDYKEQTQQGPFPVQFLTTDAVVVHGDEVLMIRRGTAPGKGLWALPGGFKDHNETFFESCLRELKEETQIRVPEKVLRGSVKEEKMFDFPDRSSRGTTVSLAYSFVLDPAQTRPRVKAADDAVMAWWFPLDKLEEMGDEIYEDHRDIIEYMTSRL